VTGARTSVGGPMAVTGPVTGSQAVAELRHHLRTPVNHIVGYTEMLLEDVPADDRALRGPLEEILAAAQDVLARISSVLAPTLSQVPGESLLGLYGDLREPQQRIVRAVTALQTAGGAPLDAAALDDLGKILRAAEQLTPNTAPRGDAPSGNGARTGEHEAASAVLVVDDDAGNRDILQRRLQRLGLRVIAAESGPSALDTMARESVDLVLLDVMMPGMDGYEVLSRIKADPATRDVPVIVISALDDLSAAVRCIEQGAEDFLSKPFEPVLLKARVGASLEKKRLRDRERAYLRDVDQVLGAAGAVEAGTYQAGTLGGIARRADELGKLARVFDAMATQVRAREQQLHEQVRALRNEIATARSSTGGGTARATEEPALRTGERLAGRYDILASLGVGGMGAVYRARDLELGEEVALKTLRRDLVGDAQHIERFKTEIRLARRISHRNVVRTHDLGEWQGTYFLTMEYVEGITVRELIDTRGRLGAEAVLAIGSQLADALAVAHAEGVIHRDIKPQNLLLDGQGVLKVMDFGVARLAERNASITEVGLVVGTPSYMPPEQLFGEEIDARADLWACGVVLYECLAGRLPFEAATPMALVARLVNDEPEPLPADDVPPALAATVMALLAKRPDERIPTAQALRERLGAVA
jgi:CheY-like chemotaxis protein